MSCDASQFFNSAVTCVHLKLEGQFWVADSHHPWWSTTAVPDSGDTVKKGFFCDLLKTLFHKDAVLKPLLIPPRIYVLLGDIIQVVMHTFCWLSSWFCWKAFYLPVCNWCCSFGQHLFWQCSLVLWVFLGIISKVICKPCQSYKIRFACELYKTSFCVCGWDLFFSPWIKLWVKSFTISCNRFSALLSDLLLFSFLHPSLFLWT